MKSAIFLIFFCHACVLLNAQQPVYPFQKDDTVLRKKYYDQCMKKKEEMLASIGKENADDFKKAYKEQYTEIGNLLNSTRTVTAPEAHNYLQSIVNKIIAANKELQGKELRVVFSRDWWPNAYSMGDGTLTVNAGLMVYLDNEAQLVFILCHELSHFYLDHSGKAIRKHIEVINSDYIKSEKKRLAKEKYYVNAQVEKLLKDLTFDSRQHSRENEMEADRNAFIFMKKTGYDCNAIRTSLELLDNIDDTLLYKSPDVKNLFNFADYPFKQRWIQKESSLFSAMDIKESPLNKKERDSLKTHPDCSKRILLLTDSIQKAGQQGKKFLVDEKLFNQLKKDFFVEMTEECYRRDQLSRSMYFSLMMLQAGINVPYAVYSLSRDLNVIYKRQKDHTLGIVVDGENRLLPEDYNLLLRMINRLKLDEIGSLNYYFCQQYKEQMNGYDGFEAEMRKIPKPQ